MIKEIKAHLTKPYTEKERIDFIVENNHNKGYLIEETENGSLQAFEMVKTDEEKAKAERERINLLSMTKREMFLGLYQAKQIIPDMLKAQITDPQALIEFEYANDYYRGNPLIDVIGAKLGFTTEQLDRFFETKDYTYLITTDQVSDQVSDQVTDQVTDQVEDQDDNTTDTTESDVQDELDTTTSKSDETNTDILE